MVKAYAGILACPVTAVQNSSFGEQRRPLSWKMVPVPKLKPVIDINKYLRPISPTSVNLHRTSSLSISFLLFWRWLIQISISVLYPTRPYVHATCTWLQATDGSGAAVRVDPFDYRKAFEISDHTLFVRKVFGLSFPELLPSGWPTS